MSIESRMADLSCDLKEILASHAAVRGPDFAHAVAVVFECQQLIEIMGKLCALCPEECDEYVGGLSDAAMDILSSIMAKATCGEITEGDLGEVLRCADMLMVRRGSVIANIAKDLHKGRK